MYNQARVKGKKIFQPKRINWSYLKRGKAARTKTNKNITAVIFKEKHKIPSKKCINNKSKGICQPPKNNIVNNELIKSILPYSPRKNRANPIEAYSTLYPATNSASASGKSKGARLVSAKPEIKKIKAIGNNNNTFQ